MIDRLAVEHSAFTPRRSPLPTVRLRCHAAHPNPRSPRGRCDTILADVPGWPQFERLDDRAPEQPDEFIRVRCHRCGAWNVFRIITPDGRIEAMEPTTIDRDALDAMANELSVSLSEKDQEIGGRVRRVLAAPPAERLAYLQRFLPYHDCTWYVTHLEARATSIDQAGEADALKAARYRRYAELLRQLQVSKS